MANEKVKELTQKLEDGVKSVFDSEAWKQFLTMQAKFHRYSFANTILIWSQMPTASQIAGFNTWKSLGRHVVKGAKAIKILAPIIGNIKEKDKDGKEVEKKGVVGFKAVNVFDISQTEGKDLPNVGLDELEGNSETSLKLIEALEQVIEIPVSYEEVSGGAKGYYSPSSHSIVIQQDMSKDQTVKTLIHEYAHSLLHHKGAEDRKGKSRGQVEAEAEGTAYVVASYFGLNTDEYSFGYVAGWTASDEGIETLKKVGATIQKTAQTIIERIEGTFGKKQIAVGA